MSNTRHTAERTIGRLRDAELEIEPLQMSVSQLRLMCSRTDLS